MSYPSVFSKYTVYFQGVILSTKESCLKYNTLLLTNAPVSIYLLFLFVWP